MYRIFNIILTFVLLFLFFRIYLLKENYDKIIAHQETIQKVNGVSYKIIRGPKDKGILVVSDLLGINVLTSSRIDHEYKHSPYDGSQVIIYQMKDALDVEISTESFLDVISTKNGVILADNFCTESWDKLRQKKIYQNTNLSPGPYCFSEPQTTLIHNLINKHKVNEAIIYYDSKAYLELIENFISYLIESDIAYTLVTTPEE